VNVDLLILGLISFFAFWGALSGVAKQVVHLASFVLAYLIARPLAELVGPHLAKALHAPSVLGIVAATLLSFIGVLVVVRMVGTPLLRRVLAGKNPEDHRVDRSLGMLFGALKTALLIYLVLCCLTFVEDNVTVAGRRLGITPKDSRCFTFAREHNLITLSHFPALDDLVLVANASSDPRKLERLEHTPAFQALRKDPRFRSVLGEQSLRKAFESGDAATLLRNNPVLELVQDPALADKLKSAAGASRDTREAAKN
jgi:membrane protein required for colicin V production